MRKIKSIKILYKCGNCFAIYENKKRAIDCHQGLIKKYYVTLWQRDKNFIPKEAGE